MTTDLNNIRLWTALITPMHNDGSIDFDSLSFCLKKQADAGNGILLCGSTGEGLALSMSEQQSIIEHAANLQLNTPLMVGVGGYQLEKQLKFLAFCESQPIDAYLLVQPLYAKPGPKGQQAWFTRLMDAVTRPCMLYNIPSRTGSEISLQMLSKLSHPNLWAFKESSGSLQKFQAYQNANPKIRMFSGDDASMPAFSMHGAKGLVSVISNIWPEEVYHYVDLFLNGDPQADIHLWNQATTEMFAVSNPIAVKALLAENNWIQTPMLRAPLCAEDLTNLDTLISIHQEMINCRSTAST